MRTRRVGELLHIGRERPHPLGAAVQRRALGRERRNLRIELDEGHFERRLENRERKSDGATSGAEIGDAASCIRPSRRDDERGIRAGAMPKAELTQKHATAEKAFLVKAFCIFGGHAEP